MLIYLDSKDLINLLEKSDPIPGRELRDLLIDVGARLALSFITIAELSAPLRSRGAPTNVMRLLSDLESLPHVFLADCRVERLELEEAVSAFTSGREYSPVDPFVGRFDFTVPLRGRPATAIYLDYSIAETVWDLWCNEPSLFDGFAGHRHRLESAMAEDRTMTDPPSLRDHFPVVVERNLRLYGVSAQGVDIKGLGGWIYSAEERCPANRITYETWHRLRANVTDKLEPSDMSDFNHLLCLPYVDVATLDNRMLAYVRATMARWPEGILARCLRNASEVIRYLRDGKRG